MDKYIIMNKNIPLVKTTMSAAGYITEVLQIYNPEAFPVGIFTDDFNKLADKLNQWWRSRIIPASRDGLRYILHLYDVESSAFLSKRSLGLSLSDQYWLKPVGSELTWQEVNFFTNDFSKELGEAFFQKESSRPAINPFTPDASSNGFGYDVADNGSYIGRFVVEAEKANVTYGLGYEYQKGDSVKANKWMANVNWSF